MTPAPTLNWEVLQFAEHYRLRRAGRYLVAELSGSHLVVSTSFRNGGQSYCVRYICNHQSCEATAHRERHEFIRAQGQEAYHNSVCGEMRLPPEEVALLGTAANMNYAAQVTHEDQTLAVTAVVTAGVQGNATCAGDPAHWREGEQGWQKVNGTINTMLFINRPVTEAAMAQAIVTMTEGKSAALQRLSVPSLYSSDLATGTGTDQYAIAAPAEGAPRLTSASSHVKLGELIGGAVRDATLEALRWQNGLEPSYTRSIFAALGRFGLHEETFFDRISPLLNEGDFDLLRRNSKSVFYEPHVSAAAYAYAAVLDRVRYGTLPEGAAQEALRHQAACMAVSLSAKPYLWDSFRARISGPDPILFILQAIAIGWAAKWRS
jgi:adenosylcobinamide amidohydrolase